MRRCKWSQLFNSYRATLVRLLILMLILISGCTQHSNSGNEFLIYAHHENMNDELRESLFKCLIAEEIEYKIDRDKNVLIKKKDLKPAVARCS